MITTMMTTTLVEVAEALLRLRLLQGVEVAATLPIPWQLVWPLFVVEDLANVASIAEVLAPHPWALTLDFLMA